MLRDIYDHFTKSNIDYLTNLQKSVTGELIFSEARASEQVEQFRPPKEELRELVGKTKKYPETIGNHPNFDYLDNDETEKHHIVSVFVDIKGSTLLCAKLPLETVRFIKNGILTIAIDIFQSFDGHIHRLQGDAIFAYFGRKGTKKSDAIIDALNATSFLQSYFKYHLSRKFEELALPQIKIRIGLDFGNTEDVLWSRYGIYNCDEVTTTSIYTDLASKLQAKAPANSTMIGNNIIDFLDLPEEFYSIKKVQKDGQTVEDTHIYDNNFITYRMYIFDWEKYLSRFAFLAKENDAYTYKFPKHLRLNCFYRKTGEPNYDYEYKSNCGALNADYNLKFKLTVPEYINYNEVHWEVVNRGKEAKDDNALNYDLPDYKNKLYSYRDTKYKGHHYMKCTVKYQNRIIAQEYFGVFINNN